MLLNAGRRSEALKSALAVADPLAASARNLAISLGPLAFLAPSETAAWLLSATAFTLTCGAVAAMVAEPVLSIGARHPLHLRWTDGAVVLCLMAAAGTGTATYAVLSGRLSPTAASLLATLALLVPVTDLARMLFQRADQPTGALLLSVLGLAQPILLALVTADLSRWLLLQVIGFGVCAIVGLARARHSMAGTRTYSGETHLHTSVRSMAGRCFTEFALTAGLGLGIILAAGELLSTPEAASIRFWQLVWMPIGLFASGSRVLLNRPGRSTIRQLWIATAGVAAMVSLLAILVGTIGTGAGMLSLNSMGVVLLLQASLAALGAPWAFTVRSCGATSDFIRCRSIVLIASTAFASLGLAAGEAEYVAFGLLATSGLSLAVWYMSARKMLRMTSA